ncbi:MAG: hypothetical protein R2856_28045 [Caldilineaceae bacterium]
MIKVSVFSHNAELTDTLIRQRVAVGADAIDFGGYQEMPGVAEQGYPDLEWRAGAASTAACAGHGDQPRHDSRSHRSFYAGQSRR